MKRNYLKSLFTALLLLCCATLSASNFEVDGICYDIIDYGDCTVGVTYKGSGFVGNYSGDITIPACVRYSGTTYRVTTIKYGAFMNCSSLTSITIPNSVTTIESSAFYYCSSLTSIAIPNSVTTIEDDVFDNCSSLISVIVDESNRIYDSRDNCNAIIETATNKLITGCQNTLIPNSVVIIGEGAFNGRSGLTSIIIPNSVTTIEDYAFQYCERLTNIKIGNSVTMIGASAFNGCTRLTSITIPNSVTKIGQYAFYGCSSLESITIPENVKKIESNVFDGCSKLTSITIPNNVTMIGASAFNYCRSLTSITIPNSVTTIGSDAFRNCSSLKSITSLIPAGELFALYYEIFDGVNKNTCTLYVPHGAKAIYASTDGWKEFKNIVELEASDNEPDINPDKEFVLNDGDAYTATLPQEYKKITYNRTFNNKGWQAWYVPFAVDYNILKDDFDVAEINDMHQFDDNNDGLLDRLELEIIRVTSGTLEANYPYLVRAKSIGSKSIVVENTVLETAVDNTIDCSSVKTKYSFVGTLSGISGNVMYNNGYYALGGGKLVMAEDNTVYLKPLRWYMNIESRNNVKAVKSIGISFEGEITGVEDIVTENYDKAVYYDLSGRRVENPTRGIYIVNGRKVIIK